MTTEPNSEDGDEVIFKKCPICHDGIIEFEGNWVDAWGDCKNYDSPLHNNDGFFVLKLDPFTVNHVQEPLYRYVLDMDIPHNLTNGGLNFYLRGNEDDKIAEALTEAIIAAKELLDAAYDKAIDEWSIDWDGEEIDDGKADNYVLEDIEKSKMS